MNYDDLLNELCELFAVPKTLDEAIAMVKGSPTLSNRVADVAFRQAVTNVLILSGLVKENDLNAAIEHFKGQLYEQLGKELLEEAKQISKECAEMDLDIDSDAKPKDKDKVPQA